MGRYGAPSRTPHVSSLRILQGLHLSFLATLVEREVVLQGAAIFLRGLGVYEKGNSSGRHTDKNGLRRDVLSSNEDLCCIIRDYSIPRTLTQSD